MLSNDPAIAPNATYYYAQCAFRTEDYVNCVKGMTVLARRWPNSSPIKKGYVTKFCVYMIDQVASVQTNWDYFRYSIRNDEKGNPIWRESIPPGPKLKRINPRLGFGLYRVLNYLQPNSPEDVAAKQKLQKMLDVPITMIWVDEKAAQTRYGHPGDFLTLFSTNEKKAFSKVICQRMFYDFETEYLYRFLNMHDDVRNLKPRFVAVSKPPLEATPVAAPAVVPPAPLKLGAAVTTAPAPEEDVTQTLTLGKLFQFAGYYPWLNSYTNTIESAPTDLNL